MDDLKFISTKELLAELENRHIAMVFVGIPPSAHNDREAGDCKVVKDFKGNTFLLIGLCEMMKTAATLRGIKNADFTKNLDD